MSSPAAILLLLMAGTDPAGARLSKAELDRVSVSPEPGARAPLDLAVTDAESGRRTRLGAVLGDRPALLLPVDYTCRNVCDPMVVLSAEALGRTGLPAQDRRLILIGIDPRDDAATARDHVGALWGDRAGRPVSLIAAAGEITRLTGALGYRFLHDPDTDSFAHPAAALILTGDGRLARVLSPLALDGKDLRLALTEAGEGQVGGLTGRLALLCYGFDAAHGIYAPLVGRILSVFAALTVAGIGLLILTLVRLRRRQETG